MGSRRCQRTGDRPGKWKPKYPIPGQSQPGVSWDPDGHWDHDNGKRTRTRWLPDGGGQVGHGNSPIANAFSAVGNFVYEHRVAFIAGAVVAGAIILAPETGGASLAVIAAVP